MGQDMRGGWVRWVREVVWGALRQALPLDISRQADGVVRVKRWIKRLELGKFHSIPLELAYTSACLVQQFENPLYPIRVGRIDRLCLKFALWVMQWVWVVVVPGSSPGV